MKRSKWSYLIPYAMKNRLILSLLLSASIPLLLLGSISYYSIFYILENKVEKGIQSNLVQDADQLGSILDNLDYASRQLAFDGEIGRYLRDYLSSDDPVDQVYLLKDIRSKMTLINYTNPRLGTMEYYWTRTGAYITADSTYESRTLDFGRVPKILERNGVVFYGPHPSIYVANEDLVFSCTRVVGDFGSDNAISIYIETNYKVFRELFDSSSYGMKVGHLLMDRNNVILYSGEPDAFPAGTKMSVRDSGGKAVEGGRYLFSFPSDNGWKLSAVIAPGEYNREIRAWLIRFCSVGLLSIVVSAILGWLIWKTMYRPMRRLKEEIQLMGTQQVQETPKRMGIMEFDDLLLKFSSMRTRIGELLVEVENKERNKRYLEVEKLLYQMNPHFIHNTLNTAQWLAMMNCQDEVVDLLATFSRLLNYNMGKEGGIVEVREEIEALKDYVKLQQLRYNHKFSVEYELEEAVMSTPVPRFILQPLVENSLYHGFRNQDGTIRVTVASENGCARISVADNGAGMTREEVEALYAGRSDKSKKAGFGIGLQFVNNIMRIHYGEEHTLRVESEAGKGTRMTLTVPAAAGRADHVTYADR